MKPQIIRHGEVLLVPSEIPSEAKLVSEESEQVVAHSETGHHHVLTAPKLAVYEVNGEMYLDVKEAGRLWHQKTGVDVHKEHEIIPAKYKVVIKRAYDYFTKKIEQVRD